MRPTRLIAWMVLAVVAQCVSTACSQPIDDFCALARCAGACDAVGLLVAIDAFEQSLERAEFRELRAQREEPDEP